MYKLDTEFTLLPPEFKKWHEFKRELDIPATILSLLGMKKNKHSRHTHLHKKKKRRPAHKCEAGSLGLWIRCVHGCSVAKVQVSSCLLWVCRKKEQICAIRVKDSGKWYNVVMQRAVDSVMVGVRVKVRVTVQDDKKMQRRFVREEGAILGS